MHSRLTVADAIKTWNERKSITEYSCRSCIHRNHPQRNGMALRSRIEAGRQYAHCPEASNCQPPVSQFSPALQKMTCVLGRIWPNLAHTGTSQTLPEGQGSSAILGHMPALWSCCTRWLLCGPGFLCKESAQTCNEDIGCLFNDPKFQRLFSETPHREAEFATEGCDLPASILCYSLQIWGSFGGANALSTHKKAGWAYQTGHLASWLRKSTPASASAKYALQQELFYHRYFGDKGHKNFAEASALH